MWSRTCVRDRVFVGARVRALLWITRPLCIADDCRQTAQVQRHRVQCEQHIVGVFRAHAFRAFMATSSSAPVHNRVTTRGRIC
ncbi:unnamed protein product [Sphagnum balticum]